MMASLRGWLRRQLHARDLGLERRPEPLLEHWGQQLRVDAGMVLAHLLLHRAPLRFLQIGAYDGAANDLLHPFIRRGLLHGGFVEPQPGPCSQLQANYAGCDGLDFVQAAVAREAGEAKFYRVRGEVADLVQGSRQMAGFSPDVLLKHYAGLLPDPQAAIETFTVPTVTCRELLERGGVAGPDVLQIDTEGFDYEVLKLWDFTAHRPALVNFEAIHLSRADRHAAYRLLLGHGYLLEEHGWDCVAYRREVREAPFPVAVVREAAARA